MNKVFWKTGMVCLLAGFGLTALSLGQSSTQSKKAVVEGIVTYTGSIPKPVLVEEAKSFRQLIEVHPKTKGLKDAVVWLEGVKGPLPKSKKKLVKVDQRDFFFLPHVLAIEDGQEVEFLNSDPPNHGVLATAFEEANSFNTVVPPGSSFKHRFVAAKRPIAITCSLHAGMGAWIFVFKHPYFAVTDKEGKFRIDHVPPGKVTLMVQHMDGGLKRKLELEVKSSASEPLRIEFISPEKKKP
jgi:plastocyanin